MTKPKPYHWYAMQLLEDLFKRNDLKACEVVGCTNSYWINVKRGGTPLTQPMIEKIIKAANGAVVMSDLIEDYYPKDDSLVAREREFWRKNYEQK